MRIAFAASRQQLQNIVTLQLRCKIYSPRENEGVGDASRNRQLLKWHINYRYTTQYVWPNDIFKLPDVISVSGFEYERTWPL